MTTIELDLKNHYCWMWRFLFTWDRLEWFVGYYPDYENCTWWHIVKRGNL